MQKKNVLIILSFTILVSSFFYVFISARLFDSDFWWHISTGRYIVETGIIPDKDPFSFTSNLKENKNLLPEREKFILKQYWLAQVIFYLTYDSLGPKGIIITRAVILITVLLLILWKLKRSNVSFYISFVYVFFVYLEALRYTGERPVLFTILFTPLTFIILEGFKENKRKVLFILLPLMLLWANLHGGFIIGNIIIAVYMFCEGLKIIFKKVSYNGHNILTFYTATTMALLISYINPTGWEAFFIAFSPTYKFFEAGIQEYQSPLFLYVNKLSPVAYGYVTLALLFPVILILRNKKMDLTHVVLLSGLFIMAAKTGRYSIYYVSIASMILGKETELLFQNLFKRISDNLSERVISVFSIVTLLSSILFFVGVFKFQWLRFDVAKGSFVPVIAVDFIEKNKIAGNIFNADPYGGYLTWRLYPWKKNFIDTRWLNYTIQAEYGWLARATETISSKKLPEGKTPLWKRLLNHYNINFVLLDTLDVYGNVPRLLLVLTEDEEWIPVYSDFISIIFVRNVPENKDVIAKFKQSKENIYNIIIGMGSQMAIIDRRNPTYLKTLGETFYEMGRLEDALTAYRYADKRRPHDDMIKNSIIQIESELKKKGKNEKH